MKIREITDKILEYHPKFDAEVIDWTVMSYIRDAVQLGKVKAAFSVGHFKLEELGMKYAADWIPEVIGHAVPVHYVASGDIYRFE